MSSLFPKLVCCVTVLGGLLPAQAASPTGVEQEITRLEKECNDAYAANNLPKYFSFYADDAVLIFVNERTTVPDYRKMWTEEVKTAPLEAVKLSDMVIRVTPAADAAIASYQIEVRTRHSGGKTTDELYFETDVWIHQGNAWKIGHVHFSPIPPK